MSQFVISTVSFSLGLLVLAAMLPGMRVRGMWGAIKAAVVCGLLSTVLGKILLVVLSLVFFLPIVLTGPLGVFAVQGLVNAILLAATARLVDGVDFDGRRTLLWAAFALTLVQTIARAAG